MKILLVWPKARTDPDWGGDLGAIAEPLALEYLAAGLLQDNHTVKILDLRLHPDGLVNTLSEYLPDVLGVTSFSMHVSAALKIMQTAKSLLPNILTVVGGHHATIYPEDFFSPCTDIVVKGEGIFTLKEIVLNKANSGDFDTVSGIFFRDENGCFTETAKAVSRTLDELPFPNRTLTEADRGSYFIDWMMPIALLRTSLGCPYRCSFCSLWKVAEGKYFKRSIEKVLEEVKLIKEDFVFLIDDEAFIDSNRMLEMALLFKKYNIKKRFFSYARIDTILRSREVLEAWKEVGLERLFVGIDAFNAKDLKEYNKKLSVSQIEDGLKLAQELDIEIFAQFVVNTNYTEKEFTQLVRFVEHFKIDYPTFTILTPLPGTELLKPDFSNVTKKQPNGRPDWDYFDTQSLVMETKISPEKFRNLYRGLFKIFANSYSQFLIHKPKVINPPTTKPQKAYD